MHRLNRSLQVVCADICRGFQSQSCRYASSSSPRPLHRPKKIRFKEKPIQADQPSPRKNQISLEQFQKMSRFAKNMINMTATTPQRGWKHSKHPRAEEARIHQALKGHQELSGSNFSQNAKHHATEDAFEEGEETTTSPVFQPGTFVETRRNELVSHGVVLSETYLGRRWRAMVISSTGEIWHPLREDVMFAVAGFASADLVSRCGDLPIASDELQLNARAQVIKRLRQIDKAVESAYCIVETYPQKIHRRLCHLDPNTWNTVTLTEVARLIYSQNADLVNTFAVHKFIMGQPQEFVADDNYRLTHTFFVRPTAHVDVINSIRDMTKERGGALDDFATRARSMMSENTRILRESRNEPPCQSPGKHTWTDSDKKILQFLAFSLRPHRSSQSDPYVVGRTIIVKRIDPTLSPVNDDVVHQILVKLGALAPWQDLVTLQPGLQLDQSPEAQSPCVASQNAIIARGFSTRQMTSGSSDILGPQDFHRMDPLDSVRHDFGSMPVYVIDDATAQELDDGLSIEAIPSEPNAYWVHVHVADPASVLPRTHVFAEEARKLGETHYYLHRTWPMLPRALMQQGLSLGSAGPDKPTRVITFSGKVDADGDIVEHQVRAGLIRNIQILTYAAVDAAMDNPVIFKYPFENEVVHKDASQCVLEHQLSDLRILDSIAKRIHARRQNVFGCFATSRPTASVRAVGEIPSTGLVLEPATFRGFPNLRYAVSSSMEEDTGSTKIVAEMAKLACRVASRFGIERGIPLVRRATGPPVANLPEQLSDLLSRCTSNGYVNYTEALKSGVVFQAAEYTIEPAMHWGMGIPDGEGYARATSPLRRYVDLLQHWQIHHALLGSAAKSSSPPFSAEYLRGFAEQQLLAERRSKRAQTLHRTFWANYYIKRQLEELGADHPLFANMTAEVTSVLRSDITTNLQQGAVSINGLGATAALVAEKKKTPKLGDTVPVRITSIQLGVRPLIRLEQR